MDSSNDPQDFEESSFEQWQQASSARQVKRRPETDDGTIEVRKRMRRSEDQDSATLEGASATPEASGSGPNLLPLYVYKPLSRPNNIRRLILQPAKDTWNADLECALEEISLPKMDQGTLTPRRYEDGFEALSYCWGEPVFSKHLVCDGHQILITENLFAALRRLRQPTKVRNLWIDAVCINQMDVAERNGQILLMARIYASALHVLAWLGEESSIKDGEISMSALCLIAATADGSRDARVSEGADQDKPRRKRREVGFNASKLVRSRASALVYAALFQRAKIKFGLLELLPKYRHLECKDPRDKIYALLSLSHNPSVSADYSLTVQEAYEKLAIAEVERGNVTNVLTTSSIHRNSQYDFGIWPSWIPDWRGEVQDTWRWDYDISFYPKVTEAHVTKDKVLHFVGISYGAVRGNPVKKEGQSALTYSFETTAGLTCHTNVLVRPGDMICEPFAERSTYRANMALVLRPLVHGGTQEATNIFTKLVGGCSFVPRKPETGESATKQMFHIA